MPKSIGSIANYYGGLWVKEEGGKFWWSIECYNGHDWEEIPESLYRELTKFDDDGAHYRFDESAT